MTCKYRIAAVGLALAAPAAQTAAQQVTLYGIIDTAIGEVSDGKGRTRQLMSGGQSASRYGFAGTEDLGGGLRAFFRLEGQFSSDSGDIPAATAGFFRRSHVGIGGAYGELYVGRDYSPAFYSVSQNDAMALGMFGTLQTVLTSGIATSRFSNGVFYASPVWSGWQVRAMYGLGERDSKPHDGGNAAGVGVYYADGPWRLNLYYHDMRVAPAATSKATFSTTARQFGGGGSYDFGTFKLTGAFGSFDPPGDANRVSFVSGGGVYTFGASQLLLQVARYRTEVKDAHATTVGLAYVYYLSKRSNLYASWGRTDNGAGASFSLNNAQTAYAPAAAGLAVRGVMAGIRHVF